MVKLLDPDYDEASGTLTYNAILLAENDEAGLVGQTERATGTPRRDR